MNYWLLKSEPFVYSFDKLMKEGIGTWDGVRNYQARNYLRAMKCGDLGFFYHSNEGLEIVGIVEITKEAFPDPTFDGDRWSAIEVTPLIRLERPVSLVDIKKTAELKGMVLVNNTRLSVQPVKPSEWDTILQMSGTDF
ncbi:MAG: EVE domain-containing protein [Saprospiraceae bacterium]|jgi:predicted RNA-binding protein with PUA-like domain|nr:EVE domain-containing protein [Saprospiraceae bacterium]